MSQEDIEATQAPLIEHLTELRSRLIRSVIGLGIAAVVCFIFADKIFNILLIPYERAAGDVGELKLIYTAPQEYLFTQFKIALFGGLFIAFPVIASQLYMFVAPGLYKNERRVMIPIVVLSTFFFIGGALFGYFIVFPWGFQFFLSFASDSIKALPSMKEYLSFATKLLLAFGLVFELPIVITFLARLGLVTVPFLRENRKYAVLLFFVGAAMITPPDVVTQIMMAFPLMLLYEISIWGAILFGQKEEEAVEPSQDAT